MTTSPLSVELPDRLGDFAISGVLGQGGSGVVYDARWGHREVALKVLHPNLVATAKEREQFLVEARRLSEIAHAGVVKVLSVGELADGRPYLAMEKLAGETLATRLSRGALPAETALRLFAQLADAVQALHDQALVHRDLKPENIVIVDDHAVLLDFGIAKSLAEPASTTTSDGGVRGTPAYMAPERFFGSPASIQTDVYELAVVLFAMLAGRLPWDDCGDPEVRLNPLRLADAAPALPPALDVELARALSTRAANRPASAKAFAEAVRVAAGGAAAPVSPSGRMTAEVKPQVTPPAAPAWFDRAKQSGGELAVAPTVNARPAKRKRRWPWIVAALVVVAGAGTAIAIVAMKGKDTPISGVAADDPWAVQDKPTTKPAKETAPTEPKVKIIPPKSERPIAKELRGSIAHFAHDTQAVIGISVDDLRQDADLSTMIFDNAKAKQLGALLDLEGCDIDFARTTDWVAIGMTEGTKSADAIISGRWTRDAIEACLGGVRRAEIQHLEIEGAQLTRLHGDGTDRWLGWLDDHTFLITTREGESGAWMSGRVRATDGPGGVVAELATQLDDKSALWAVADAKAIAGNALLTIPPGHVIAKATLGDGVDLRVRVRYPDAAQAHHAHELIDQQLDAAAPGARSMGIMSTEDHDDVVDLRVVLERPMLHAVTQQMLEK